VIEKAPGAPGEVVVTFRLAPEITGETACVVGEFNGWSVTANPMTRDETSFVATVSVAAGATYRFRYLIDGARWENDWQADMYAPNEFGGDDSVLDVTAPIAVIAPGDQPVTPDDPTCDSCGVPAAPLALVDLDDDEPDRRVRLDCLAYETSREASPL
jgi:hypothetical protein